MEVIRTTLCQFDPDLARADVVYDFAVLGASRDLHHDPEQSSTRPPTV
jgi:hypothetical protein